MTIVVYLLLGIAVTIGIVRWLTVRQYAFHGRHLTIDALIVYGLTFLAAIIKSLTDGTVLVAPALTNVILITLGFGVVAARSCRGRSQHIVAVALIDWWCGFVSVLTGLNTPARWFFGAISITLCACLGLNAYRLLRNTQILGQQ